MDNMSYTYKANTNQLDKVVDAAADASSTNYPRYNDIKQGQANGNYTYDEIGNLKTDVSEGITNISWNVYGKITTITKSGNTINYTYDAAGNRISKTYQGKTTWYVRDASGNVMSTYLTDASINGGALTQSEIHLYGSSRLGIYNLKTNVQSVNNQNAIVTFERANKFFELTNHLGNVLVTVSDKKIGHDAGNGTINYYNADVITAGDYYPFGMTMPGRKFTATASSSYRYGFNGKENDKDAGEGIQDYGMRIYDMRIGKFLSVDPIGKAYPWNSTYAFAENDVMRNIDLDGGEKREVITRWFKDCDGTLISNTRTVDLHNSYNLGGGTLYTTVIEYSTEEARERGATQYVTTQYMPEEKHFLGNIWQGIKEFFGAKQEFGFVLSGNGNGTRLDIGSDGVPFKESLDIGTMLAAIGNMRDFSPRFVAHETK